jgi:hypothetical protein
MESLEAADGNFYGTTAVGGQGVPVSSGVLFKVDWDNTSMRSILFEDLGLSHGSAPRELLFRS